MYSFNGAIDYRTVKTGIKGELVPARARDVCASSGVQLRGGADGKEKNSYHRNKCNDLRNKPKRIKTMRSLAKANGLLVKGEPREPSRLLKLAQLSGFAEQASLVDIGHLKKDYQERWKGSLDKGKMALVIYDINPKGGGPGMNAGKKASWRAIFGYYQEKDGIDLLAVNGRGGSYNWTAFDSKN